MDNEQELLNDLDTVYDLISKWSANSDALHCLQTGAKKQMEEIATLFTGKLLSKESFKEKSRRYESRVIMIQAMAVKDKLHGDAIQMERELGPRIITVVPN